MGSLIWNSWYLGIKCIPFLAEFQKSQQNRYGRMLNVQCMAVWDTKHTQDKHSPSSFCHVCVLHPAGQ